jgi:hypothetical protein
MNKILPMLALAVSTATLAKLPAPSDEAKTKAAEAAAKTAHGNKVDAYKTCLSADKAAAHYFKTHPKAAKPGSAPACADPGPFGAPTTPAVAAAGPKVAPAKAGSGKP